MNKKVFGITASVVLSSIILVIIIGSTDLTSYQSESLRYNINTECQVYAEFVNWGITPESLDDPQINPKLTSLIHNLISLDGDPRDHLERIQKDNPQCKNELGKLKPSKSDN
ncbi:MAG: hypothetical protein ACE5R5_00010 [Nitrosarchaeum sp.]